MRQTPGFFPGGKNENNIQSSDDDVIYHRKSSVGKSTHSGGCSRELRPWRLTDTLQSRVSGEKNNGDDGDGWLGLHSYGINGTNSGKIEEYGKTQLQTALITEQHPSVMKADMAGHIQNVTASTPPLFLLFLVSLLWMPFNRWKRNVPTPTRQW